MILYSLSIPRPYHLAILEPIAALPLVTTSVVGLADALGDTKHGLIIKSMPS